MKKAQCCGEPFAVGSQVFLDTRRCRYGLAWRGTWARAAGVDAAEEHRGGLSEAAPETAATVSGISAVHCRACAGRGLEKLQPRAGLGRSHRADED
jgi:hypothetical protein